MSEEVGRLQLAVDSTEAARAQTVLKGLTAAAAQTATAAQTLERATAAAEASIGASGKAAAAAVREVRALGREAEGSARQGLALSRAARLAAQADLEGARASRTAAAALRERTQAANETARTATETARRQAAETARASQAIEQRIALLTRGTQHETTRAESLRKLAGVEAALTAVMARGTGTLTQRIALTEQLARVQAARARAAEGQTRAETGVNAAQAGVVASMRSLTGLVRGGVYTIIASEATQAALKVIRVADAQQMLSARMGLVAKSATEAAATQAQLLRLANDAGLSMDDAVRLYTRTATAARDLGANQQQALVVTRAVAQALQLGGSAAGEAAGATLQFTQMIGSGAVQAEELNSILDGAPALARAIAAGLGLSVAQFRTLVKDGKVTSDQVFGALLKQAGAINAQFAQLPASVARASQALENNVGAQIGRLDRAIGATKWLAKLLGWTASQFEGPQEQRARMAEAGASTVDPSALRDTRDQAELTRQAIERRRAELLTASTAPGKGTEAGQKRLTAATDLAAENERLMRTNALIAALDARIAQEAPLTPIKKDPTASELAKAERADLQRLEPTIDAAIRAGEVALDAWEQSAKESRARATGRAEAATDARRGAVAAAERASAAATDAKLSLVDLEQLQRLAAVQTAMEQVTLEQEIQAELRKQGLEDGRSAEALEIRRAKEAEAYNERLLKLIAQRRGAEEDALDRVKRRAEEAAERVRQIGENLTRGLQQAGADAFEGLLTRGLKSFRDFADTVKRLFIRAFAEVLAADATAKLFGFGGFSFGGAAGGAGSVAAGSGGGVTGSVARSALGSVVGGGLRKVGGFALGGLGKVAGAIGLGSLFGKTAAAATTDPLTAYMTDLGTRGAAKAGASLVAKGGSKTATGALFKSLTASPLGAGALVAGAGGLLGSLLGRKFGTAAGVGGGAASGALAGAAIGSVVPVLGTVVGGVIGGVAGAIGGLFGGKKRKRQREEARRRQAAELAAFGEEIAVRELEASGDALGAQRRRLQAQHKQELEATRQKFGAASQQVRDLTRVQAQELAALDESDVPNGVYLGAVEDAEALVASVRFAVARPRPGSGTTPSAPVTPPGYVPDGSGRLVPIGGESGMAVTFTGPVNIAVPEGTPREQAEAVLAELQRLSVEQYGTPDRWSEVRR